MISLLLLSCKTEKKSFTSFDQYPSPTEENLWLNYTKEFSDFKLWSPTADEVLLNLYDNGTDGLPIARYELTRFREGVWSTRVLGDLHGTYYTFQILIDGEWSEETPGIYAQAVGVNGERAMVLDLKSTDPNGWESDQSPILRHPNEAIIYELHIRDMTIHSQSGSSLPGKYLGLVEEGTKGPEGLTTGIDHLKELGITHVHLLPTFDHYSIDETKLDSAQFNWGYDPQNYNVPEGSFASDPYRAEVRIKEFKQMVKSLHDQGIGVILDVVYNHTGRTAESNFNQEVPGYYYRQWEDGSLADAAACGNETASERPMMRKFILESVAYWTREYHLDGFRFDLMGIHDIDLMNEVSKKVKEVNPNAFVYGEGWTAKDSPYPADKRALKKNTVQMPQITAFSDDLRDGLKGSVFEDSSTGFVSGGEDMEESIKFGIVGAIAHPQVAYQEVNYSDAPWTNNPWQTISYVSCHDNHTLYDKLKVSRKDAGEREIIAMAKLANAIVLTSQGTPFLHAGVEMLRTKNGEHNSYNLPDSINQIDWYRKKQYSEVFDYHKNLIALRKAHPAFRMSTGELVRSNLEFQKTEDSFISYLMETNGTQDPWKKILVAYNARTTPVNYRLDGRWQVAVIGDTFDFDGSAIATGSISVPAISMLVCFQK
ncbi:type I pullulanase [Pelagihabitans pacificus]|nr:type I pullulanase [Pelagihabitans pacificus]